MPFLPLPCLGPGCAYVLGCGYLLQQVGGSVPSWPIENDHQAAPPTCHHREDTTWLHSADRQCIGKYDYYLIDDPECVCLSACVKRHFIIDKTDHQNARM